MKLIKGVLSFALIVGAILAGVYLVPSYPNAASFGAGAIATAVVVFMQWRFNWFPGRPQP
jgi:hypothetical protein